MENSSPKNSVFNIVAAVIIGTALIIAAALFSRTGISIENLGSAVDNEGQVANTISVSGDGKVSAAPDMVTISITASEMADSTQQAKTAVDQKIQQILEILEQNNIPKEDIQTAELSLFPEYDWSQSGRSLLGQRATQRLNVDITGITEEAERTTRIIDAVAEVENIQIDSIQFDIEDKTSLFHDARKLAFQKAKEKAEELATLAGVELSRPVSIEDTAVESFPPPLFRNMAVEDSAGLGGGGEIPTGQLEVSVQIHILFGMK
jgi:uncharacterized protein YggE